MRVGRNFLFGDGGSNTVCGAWFHGETLESEIEYFADNLRTFKSDSLISSSQHLHVATMLCEASENFLISQNKFLEKESTSIATCNEMLEKLKSIHENQEAARTAIEFQFTKKKQDSSEFFNQKYQEIDNRFEVVSKSALSPSSSSSSKEIESID
eukprot:c20253_g1_i2.p1 GENE.c20253_g1_i2~~c20253_g1_i2.p1  ORF type:complete len:155 (+),score=51.30 c20253_g1_i2:42-506(+)